MNVISNILRRIALFKSGHAVDGPTPSLVGLRGRILHLSIGFSWMAKGGPYDRRTFMDRTFLNGAAHWHFKRAFRI